MRKVSSQGFAGDWFQLVQKELSPPVTPNTFQEDKNFPARMAKVRLNSFVDQEPRLPDQEIEGFSYSKKESFDRDTMVGLSADIDMPFTMGGNIWWLLQAQSRC